MHEHIFIWVGRVTSGGSQMLCRCACGEISGKPVLLSRRRFRWPQKRSILRGS